MPTQKNELMVANRTSEQEIEAIDTEIIQAQDNKAKLN